MTLELWVICGLVTLVYKLGMERLILSAIFRMKGIPTEQNDAVNKMKDKAASRVRQWPGGWFTFHVVMPVTAVVVMCLIWPVFAVFSVFSLMYVAAS